LLYSSKFNMCTSLIETLHFLFVIVCTSFHFCGWCYYLSCKLWKTLHFRKWTYVLPVVNTCTSCSHTSVLPFRGFDNSSSTFTWNLHFQNWIFVLPSTWFIIFLAFHVKAALPKLNILYFLILLHILPARIVLYFPILLHTLPARIVLYFLLDNFIIFLALHVKVALPKNEYLYFSQSPCVLPRVTGRTSLIWRMILSFLQPFAVNLNFRNLNLCTSCRHYVYFSSSRVWAKKGAANEISMTCGQGTDPNAR
jgi:hypothetical protein